MYNELDRLYKILAKSHNADTLARVLELEADRVSDIRVPISTIEGVTAETRLSTAKVLEHIVDRIKKGKHNVTNDVEQGREFD